MLVVQRERRVVSQTSAELMEELLAEYKPRTRGRARKQVHVSESRVLGAEDMLELEVEGRPTGSPRPLAKIKDSHHGLAKALASGMDDHSSSLITGYDPGRISELRKDPSFKALIDFYRANSIEVYRSIHDRMANLSLDVVAELRDRLETDPSGFTHGILIDLMKATADRTGAGPTTKAEVTHLHLTPEDMKRLQDETQERNVTILAHGRATEGIGVEVSGPRLIESVGEAAALEGLKGEGEDLREDGGAEVIEAFAPRPGDPRGTAQ